MKIVNKIAECGENKIFLASYSHSPRSRANSINLFAILFKRAFEY